MTSRFYAGCVFTTIVTYSIDFCCTPSESYYFWGAVRDRNSKKMQSQKAHWQKKKRDSVTTSAVWSIVLPSCLPDFVHAMLHNRVDSNFTDFTWSSSIFKVCVSVRWRAKTTPIPWQHSSSSQLLKAKLVSFYFAVSLIKCRDRMLSSRRANLQSDLKVEMSGKPF